MKRVLCAAAFLGLSTSLPLQADVFNLKVVTDASPDYTDMNSMIRSITGKWPTMQEKCWAMYYWVHIGRRQTNPMHLHGQELADPIRQFNDYGYAMCSTVAGINNTIWNAMGMQVRFRDLSMHTTSECYYDNAWHCYDNSMSAIYTLCDGKTVASVEDIGDVGSCDASGGKVEEGHVARYHCLYATSANGFLTGNDGPRRLSGEAHVFKWDYLKYYKHWNGWEQGHRYTLNLREGEVYTRYYHSIDPYPLKKNNFKPATDPREYYVDNTREGDNKRTPGDPEQYANEYHIRGNGVWVFKPSLAAGKYKKNIWTESNIVTSGGLQPAKAGQPASVTFRINSANVTTSMTLTGAITKKSPDDLAAISVSIDNGIHWKEIWKAQDIGETPLKLALRDEVNGAYHVLYRFDMSAATAPANVTLKDLEFRTVTQVNSKTQPKLNIGKNVIYIDAGEQTDTISIWPDNSGRENYKVYLVDSDNMTAGSSKYTWMSNLHPATMGKDAFLVYRVDAPGEITRLILDGRFANRDLSKTHPNYVETLWSVDEGKTWTSAYRVTHNEIPWDKLAPTTIVDIPAGHKSAWVKYVMSGPSSIHSTHIDAEFKPVDATFKPLEVKFTWKEVQADRSLVERSHTQPVEKLPCRYEINVGGLDHPVMESLQVNLAGSASALGEKAVTIGYSDGKDNPTAQKYIYQWQTFGKNLAVGKKVTTTPLSIKMFAAPKKPNSGTAGPNSGKLTDGIVGPAFAGGSTVDTGESWPDNAKKVDIDIDLEKPTTCGAFAIHLTSGWPWPEVWKGDWKEKIEVFTSDDGQQWTSQGLVTLNRWRKDSAINFMAPDNETLQGYNFDLVLPKSVTCRYVRWHMDLNGHTVVVTEVQAFDFIKYDPFDIRLALPTDKVEPPLAAAPTWDAHSTPAPASLTPPTFEPAYTKLWPSRKAMLQAATQPKSETAH